MKLNKFDIVLVKFPFSNLADGKVRPALVIKSLEGQNNIFCQITTKKRGIEKYEVKLLKKSCGGDIRFDSNIYLDMIFTLHESLISGKIGSIIDAGVKDELKRKIKIMFSD